jgi:tRNA-splicing ligase RtcB
MSISTVKSTGVPIELWTPVHEVESAALDQLRNIAALPWVYKHVAVMPDVHLGKGATVGSVIAMKDAVAPSAVGVDIGCGMAAIRTNIWETELPDDLSGIRKFIENAIPVGFNGHDRRAAHVEDMEGLEGLQEPPRRRGQDPERMARPSIRWARLGGGNHFIELCLDTEGQVWMVLHSGSRNIGKELAERHIKVAKTLEHNSSLPDKDLAVFLAGTVEFQRYRHDLHVGAGLRDAEPADDVGDLLQRHEAVLPAPEVLQEINCHHNYVGEERHFGEDVLVTRKGAISAREGEWGIIPGSMGTRSYIVQGLGNPSPSTPRPTGPDGR